MGNHKIKENKMTDILISPPDPKVKEKQQMSEVIPKAILILFVLLLISKGDG